MEEKTLELKEKVVAINRVAKVVKGGRTFRFSAVVVVGDENGHVGVGNGKASEVPDAIKKAIEDAKKNLITVPIVGTTIPHGYVGEFGSAKVMLKPGAEGTGIIAGGSVRPVLELAGYKDINSKVLGTNNPRNVVYATMVALKSMQTVQDVAKKRVGRGMGSGLGKTSGRGHKGQKARSGGGVRRGFEGGQTPLYRRLPKRGFKNINAKTYTEVTLSMLNKSEATEVTAESLLAEGIIGKINDGIVVLGTGNVDKKFTVKATRFTKAAAEKIEAAGGKIEVI